MKFDRSIAGIALWLIAATIQPTFAENENPTLRGKQRQLPNDAEQKASYCLAVIKLQHSSFVSLDNDMSSNEKKLEEDRSAAADPDIRKLLDEVEQITRDGPQLRGKYIEQMKDKINRLQHFLLPRVPYLEPNSMRAAYSRGEKDYYNSQKSQKSKQCMDGCKHIKDNVPKWESCFNPCMLEDDLNRRLFQCGDLPFLPY